MTTPGLRLCFEARVKVGEPLELSAGAAGRRRMIPIEGGVVTGPELNGVVLAGGADWQWIRPDGTAELEARYVIRTEEGVLIGVHNVGLRHGPAEVMQRLAAGERVDPAEYYFRAAPRFETSAAAYAWMTRTVFVASGERGPDEVRLRVWAVE